MAGRRRDGDPAMMMREGQFSRKLGEGGDDSRNLPRKVAQLRTQYAAKSRAVAYDAAQKRRRRREAQGSGGHEG